MPRPVVGSHYKDVKAAVAVEQPGTAAKPNSRSIDGAPCLSIGHGKQAGLDVAPGFYLDEHNAASVAHNQIDLAARGPDPPSERPIALADQKKSGQQFIDAAPSLGKPAVIRRHRPARSAVSTSRPGHKALFLEHRTSSQPGKRLWPGNGFPAQPEVRLPPDRGLHSATARAARRLS